MIQLAGYVQLVSPIFVKLQYMFRLAITGQVILFFLRLCVKTI